MGIFPDGQGQLTQLSLISSKFTLIRAFMVILVTCKNEDPIKNEGARVLKIFPPIIILCELSVSMKPEFMLPFPHPNDVKIKFDCHRPAGLRDINNRPTHGRTYAGSMGIL